jgi:hypothetical protein
VKSAAGALHLDVFKQPKKNGFQQPFLKKEVNLFFNVV